MAIQTFGWKARAQAKMKVGTFTVIPSPITNISVRMKTVTKAKFGLVRVPGSAIHANTVVSFTNLVGLIVITPQGN